VSLSGHVDPGDQARHGGTHAADDRRRVPWRVVLPFLADGRQHGRAGRVEDLRTGQQPREHRPLRGVQVELADPARGGAQSAHRADVIAPGEQKVVAARVGEAGVRKISEDPPARAPVPAGHRRRGVRHRRRDARQLCVQLPPRDAVGEGLRLVGGRISMKEGVPTADRYTSARQVIDIRSFRKASPRTRPSRSGAGSGASTSLWNPGPDVSVHREDLQGSPPAGARSRRSPARRRGAHRRSEARHADGVNYVRSSARDVPMPEHLGYRQRPARWPRRGTSPRPVLHGSCVTLAERWSGRCWRGPRGFWT
jgi:hypothetical protein